MNQTNKLENIKKGEKGINAPFFTFFKEKRIKQIKPDVKNEIYKLINIPLIPNQVPNININFISPFPITFLRKNFFPTKFIEYKIKNPKKAEIKLLKKRFSL